MQNFLLVLVGLLALAGLGAVVAARIMQATRLRRDNVLEYEVVGLSKTGDKVVAKFAATWRITSVVRSSDRNWQPLMTAALRAAIMGWMGSQTNTQLKGRLVGGNTDDIASIISAADESGLIYGVEISKNVLRSLVITPKKVVAARLAAKPTPPAAPAIPAAPATPAVPATPPATPRPRRGRGRRGAPATP